MKHTTPLSSRREKRDDRASDYDKCGHYHESVQMSCGGIRKDHAERYPGHSFVEPVAKSQSGPAIIENVVNGVSVVCEIGTANRPRGTITIRDPLGKTRAIINALVDGEIVKFQQACFVSSLVTHEADRPAPPEPEKRGSDE